MDIESIPEAEEENEVEKSDYNVSNIGLSFNRVETEYGEDEQSYDLYSIEEIFIRYLETTGTFLVSLVFLMISLFEFAQVSLAIVPLIILEVLRIYKNSIQYKEELPILNRFWKSEYLLKVLNSFFSLLSLICLILVLVEKIDKIFWVGLPVALNIIVRTTIRVNLANSCTIFEELISKCLLWGRLIIIVNLSLKLNFQVSFSWAAVFWPVFLMMILAGLVSFISFFLALLNFFSKERDMTMIFSHIWLLYTLIIGSFTFLLLFYFFETSQPGWLLAPILYFSGFFLLTQKLKKKLAVTWWEFFLSDHSTHPQLANDQPLPLPGSQKLYIEPNIVNKLSKVLISTPRVLAKLASPRIQTKGEKLKRRKMCRTLSQAIDCNTQANVHIRSRSSCIGTYNFDCIKIPCKFCSRNDGINKFLDCGHGELCNPCADLYLKAKRKCYVCQLPISGVSQDGNKAGLSEFSKRVGFSEV